MRNWLFEMKKKNPGGGERGGGGWRRGSQGGCEQTIGVIVNAIKKRWWGGSG